MASCFKKKIHLCTKSFYTMAKIFIEGIEFYAKHGCFKEEQLIGNLFVVDVIIDYNSLIAEKSDNINDALDYQKVFEIVQQEMSKPSFLLENLCQRIIENIKTHFQNAESISIKVAKNNPSLGKGVRVNKVATALSWSKE
jgi:dihydroneopterin aldolase